jgi:hypothetical protein
MLNGAFLTNLNIGLTPDMVLAFTILTTGTHLESVAKATQTTHGVLQDAICCINDVTNSAHARGERASTCYH